jgi:glycosyltransferase involved in cell wall biosynthesis
MSRLYTREERKEIRSNKFNVMYVGAHGKANGLGLIINCAKIIEERGIDNVEFSFVGDGSDKQTLMKQSEYLKLSNVQFKEPVPKDLVPTIMSEADAFIFCLVNSEVFRYGVSANKLFDYMSAKKPIIFSCNSSNNPVSEAEAGLTVVPQDAEALADAVEVRHSLSGKERREMGNRGWEYVKKNHDISKLTERLIGSVLIEESGTG